MRVDERMQEAQQRRNQVMSQDSCSRSASCTLNREWNKLYCASWLPCSTPQPRRLFGFPVPRLCCQARLRLI